MRLKTGMSVRVISGNHKGKEGKILRVIKDRERVIIEGVNLIKKHTRPTQENPKGGIIEREGSLHISNVMHLHNGKVSRIGYKRLDDGSKVMLKLIIKTQLKFGEMAVLEENLCMLRILLMQFGSLYLG